MTLGYHTRQGSGEASDGFRFKVPLLIASVEQSNAMKLTVALKCHFSLLCRWSLLVFTCCLVCRAAWTSAQKAFGSGPLD
eukprot:3906513-Amphidinium_carterae.1